MMMMMMTSTVLFRHCSTIKDFLTQSEATPLFLISLRRVPRVAQHFRLNPGRTSAMAIRHQFCQQYAIQAYCASASTAIAVLLLGDAPGTRHLSQMAVAIGDVYTLLHHVTPSTLTVGQQVRKWIHPDINTPLHAPKLPCYAWWT